MVLYDGLPLILYYALVMSIDINITIGNCVLIKSQHIVWFRWLQNPKLFENSKIKLSSPEKNKTFCESTFAHASTSWGYGVWLVDLNGLLALFDFHSTAVGFVPMSCIYKKSSANTYKISLYLVTQSMELTERWWYRRLNLLEIVSFWRQAADVSFKTVEMGYV